jgi:hypothetical protein
MSKFHYLSIVTLILLLLFNVVILAKNARIKEEHKLIVEKMIDLVNVMHLWRFRETETILNNGIRLNTKLIITDENNNSISLTQHLISNKNSFKLIIRHSALACDVCLIEELNLIDDYIEEIGKDNVMLLACGYNARTLKILKNSILNIPVFRIEDMGIPFERKYNNLFIFSLNKELIVGDFFIPEKTLPELSKNYYKTICDKY